MQFCHLSGPKQIAPHSLFWCSFSHRAQTEKIELEERTETQENVKFQFQTPPMLIQKFSRQFSSLSLRLSLKPKLLFRKFCSSAVGLVSSKSKFVSRCKEIGNLQQAIFLSDLQARKKIYLKKRSHLLHKITTDDKTINFSVVRSLFFYLLSSIPPLN